VYVNDIHIDREVKEMSNRRSTEWAVITGASSGLGAVFAEQLAEQGLALVLAGRDQPRLVAVQQRIRDLAPCLDVELVVGDLGTRAGVDELLAHLGERPIELLVNNAGFGTYGPFAEADERREHAMVGVNVDALMGLSRAVLPGMLARGTGGILNVASTIAFQPGPYQAVYGASKAFVLSFSQALWAETRGTGVTVTALCPGPTATGFVDALQSDVSHTAIYRRLAAPEPVVAAGLRGLERGRAVVVPGLRNKAMANSGRFSPSWINALVAARLLRPNTKSDTLAPSGR
jgi:short-subunit dehydrogenase